MYELGKKIKVAKGYAIDGKIFPNWDISFDRRDTLSKAKPIYEEFEPWERTVENDGKTLTPNAKRYIEGIEDLLQKKIMLIGIGPARDQIIENYNCIK